MASMEGKVAIVTGASSGMGLAAARSLLSLGALVFGVDVSKGPDISHKRFHFLQQDITTSSAPSTIVETCLKTFNGRIDALLNIAGVLDNYASVLTVNDAQWDKIVAINLTAPVRLMSAVAPVMKKQKSGSIVNVSSKAGIAGAAGGVAYTSAKHGLVGATKNTAWMLKDDGIRCNAICPGGVLSGLTASMDLKSDVESFNKVKPIISVHLDLENSEHWATPDMPADLIVFLASDLSRGINGSIIPVDQGWSCI